MTGTVVLPEVSAPSTPSSGYAAVYFKSDHKPYFKDSTGAEFPFSADDRVTTLSDATSFTLNCDNTDLAIQINTQAVGTLTANAVSGTPTNGQKLEFRLKSTNVQTFSWNAVFLGSTQLTLPATSSGSSKTDYMKFEYDSTATKWNLVAVNFGF